MTYLASNNKYKTKISQINGNCLDKAETIIIIIYYLNTVMMN